MKLIACARCGIVYDWDTLDKNNRGESLLNKQSIGKIFFQCRSCYFMNNVENCNRSIRIDI